MTQQDKDDIINSFKFAADKSEQVYILAQRFLCAPQDIIDLLDVSGYDVSNVKVFDRYIQKQGLWCEEEISILTDCMDKGMRTCEIKEALAAKGYFRSDRSVSKKKFELSHDVVRAVNKIWTAESIGILKSFALSGEKNNLKIRNALRKAGYDYTESQVANKKLFLYNNDAECACIKRKHTYTEEQDEWLIANYDMKKKKLCDLFNEKFDCSVSTDSLVARMYYVFHKRKSP